jgi:hypothetical protein
MTSRSSFDNGLMRAMTLWSDAGMRIDNCFVYGPAIHQIIHKYQDLTSQPLFASGPMDWRSPRIVTRWPKTYGSLLRHDALHGPVIQGGRANEDGKS